MGQAEGGEMVASVLAPQGRASPGMLHHLWPVICINNILQVGANDYAEANAPDEKTAADLRWLAELGARQRPPVKIAYESWCFSKRVNTWEKTWELVQLGVSRFLACP